MLVSHKYKFVFLKTFKTASTSVEAYLEQFCLPSGADFGGKLTPTSVTEYGIVAGRGKMNRDHSVPWRGHMPAAEIRQHLGEDIWQDYCKIVTIRNPFPRMVAAYFARFRPDPEKYDDRPALHASFRDWLIKGVLDAEGATVMQSLSDLDIYGINGEIVADVFVRIEHLTEDMAALSQRLGLPPLDAAALPHHRKRPKLKQLRGDYREYYDDEARAFVAHHFKWELETFGYQFDTAAAVSG